MKSESKFSYIFRKYPSFRTGVYLLICVIVTLVIFVVNKKLQKPPVIYSLDPVVSSGGEVVTLRGENFGEQRSDSYVELGGNRITASDYTVWTDKEIRLVLPFVVNDGLMYVITPAGRSEPVVFTNKETMPVSAPVNIQSTQPYIQELKGDSFNIGNTITISGKNFGSLKKDSKVYFSSGIDKNNIDSWIACSNFDEDYLFWSDQEIILRIPDGAASGYVYVETQNGQSNKIRFSLYKGNGKKTYSDEHTYIFSLNADVQDIVVGKDGSITLFMPVPPLSSWQRSVEIAESKPEPILVNYENSIVQQINLDNSVNINSPKYSFSNNYVVKVYEVSTEITNPTAKTQTIAKDYYSSFTKSTDLIKSDDERITQLAASIVKKETSPYKKAQLIYNYLIDNFVLLHENKPLASNTLDVLETGSVDSYDMALLFTMLGRAAGIPTIMDSGVIVQQDMTARNHWWAEFYLDTVGWVPVDPAMGAGLMCKIFQPQENPRNYYFGNLDSQHVTFSRDINNIKSSLGTGKKVYRSRTYAVQSVWEEASDETLQYSSYWAPVQVLGVY